MFASATASGYTALKTSTSSPGFFGHALSSIHNFWSGLSWIGKTIVLTTGTAIIVGIGVGVSVKKSAGSFDVDYCSYSNYRLPSNVIPRSYELTWSISQDGTQYIEPFVNTAHTTIIADVTDNSNCILLHSVDLSLSTVSIRSLKTSPGRTYRSTFSYDLQNERVIIEPSSTISNGDVIQIEIDYTSTVSSNNFGLYKSTYYNDTGASVSMLATQFEATYARHTFPCFDEPALKANFTLHANNVPGTYTPLGNMPIQSSIPNGDGSISVTFFPTPRMSTYLLAFCSGPLVSYTINGVGAGNIPVTAWATARGDNANRIAYAAQQAATIIPFYENKYQVAFPLPKMDMIAIPDFAAGAMENWGLITYRETAMLGNETTSSQSELQRVAVVVAHELAHQWFGDIVTMKWWDALWLNEGFARFVMRK
jgi:aminopeptidase N